MTYGDLEKWRKYVPFLIFSACIVPWALMRSKSLDEAKLYNELIIPLLAIVAAFVYVGLDCRKVPWKREIDAHVGNQIRKGLLDMVPRDLEVTEDEKHGLQGEIFKDLTGVFWEAIDRSDVLRSHKEHFYSNGIVYSTSIDVFLICSFVGFVYALASLAARNASLAYVAASLVAIGLFSRAFVTPRARADHLKLSTEQLELVGREQGDFVSGRFRKIIGDWRRERVLQ